MVEIPITQQLGRASVSHASQMRKFSAGENPEGVIGDVAAHSAPLYDATSQIQKFWFSVLVRLFAGHIEPAGFISCAAAYSRRHERNRA